jgi:drug/metabolite transporter superfamily protein YnfA
MTPAALAPAGFAVLIALLYYRRFRRLFGRQTVQPKRMKFRIAVLLVIGALLLLRGVFDSRGGLAVAAGLGGGVALAWLGLRLTTFETTPRGKFYTPHGGIGLALSVLLLGRLVYRFFVLAPVVRDAHQTGMDPFAAFQRSPLTLAIVALLIGYYVTYYAGVLLRSGSPPTSGDAS